MNDLERTLNELKKLGLIEQGKRDGQVVEADLWDPRTG
jgi:hypothetical protein